MDEASQAVLQLAKTKMREAGEFSREAYENFIDESLDYYVEKGRLTEEDDLDAIKEELVAMYNEIESEEVDESALEDEDEDNDDEEDDEDEDASDTDEDEDEESEDEDEESEDEDEDESEDEDGAEDEDEDDEEDDDEDEDK